MTALAAERLTSFYGRHSSRMTVPIAASVTIFKGAVVALDSAGRAIPGGLAAGGSVRVIGKSSATYISTGADSMDVEVECGVFDFNNYGSDAVDVGDLGKVVYLLDDQTVAETSDTGARIAAGVAVHVTSARVRVLMGPEVALLAAASELAAAGVSLQKRSLVLGHAALTDADTSQVVAIGAALPANARVLAVDFTTYTAFSGGTVSALTVDVGSTGDADALIDGADIFGTAVDGKPPTLTAGVHPNKTYASATQLNATVVSTGDNLVNLTAGAVTIDVLFAVLA